MIDLKNIVTFSCVSFGKYHQYTYLVKDSILAAYPELRKTSKDNCPKMDQRVGSKLARLSADRSFEGCKVIPYGKDGHVVRTEKNGTILEKFSYDKIGRGMIVDYCEHNEDGELIQRTLPFRTPNFMRHVVDSNNVQLTFHPDFNCQDRIAFYNLQSMDFSFDNEGNFSPVGARDANDKPVEKSVLKLFSNGIQDLAALNKDQAIACILLPVEATIKKRIAAIPVPVL